MFSALQDFADPAIFALFAAIIAGCAGVPGLFLRRPDIGQSIAAAMTLLAALLGLPAALMLLFAERHSTYLLDWGLPFGPCELAIDPLSAFFLLPIFLVGAAGSLFAIGYRPAASQPSGEAGLIFFYGLLISAMALLVMVRNGLFFLMLWEVMALSAYFLIMAEHRRLEVRRAGMIYLITTHSGTAVLLVFFSLLSAQCGSFLFPASGTLSALAPSALLLAVTALAGFGAKAGIMPLHIWLPAAHANAPSHVSAIMSGVMLKMGLYGILRTLSFFSDIPLRWGVILTVIGIGSALLAITFAMAQNDLKRLLAYSSIENIGIITTALGGALVGVSGHNPLLSSLCLAAALLHILNHSLFKPLLFFGSGIIIHASSTRDMNLMGGLGRAMPKTALLFLVGVLSICGIPPLNGFASEFLLYLGLFSQLQVDNLAALALLVPLLALVGGLALIAFIKLYGAVFLGTPRQPSDSAPHEAGAAMLIPLSLLALLCLLIGLLPHYALELVVPAMNCLLRQEGIPSLQNHYAAILRGVELSALLLVAAGLAVALFIRLRLSKCTVSRTSTWGCGYQRATARMQYGATAFSGIAVSVFDGIVRQRIDRPALVGLFPPRSGFSELPTETVLERLVGPLFDLAGLSFAFLRRLQHGRINVYMIYIFATLFILMLWAH